MLQLISMQFEMMARSLVWALLCASAFTSVSWAKPVKEEKWDYLLFAQFWPPTSCYIYLGEECSGIPEGVKGWTVHGLWPSIYHNDSGPFNCNTSAHFDYNKIKSLGSQLDVNWPNYNSKEDRTYLWAHEWNKHGTCAETLPVLRGEFQYFSKALELHANKSVLQALTKHRITPSLSKIYHASDFFNALKAEFKVNPGIYCEHGKDKKIYIGQVYLCFSKALQPEDCLGTSRPSSHNRDWPTGGKVEDNPYAECPYDGQTEVYFPPFKHQGERTRDDSVLFFESEVEEVVVWKED